MENLELHTEAAAAWAAGIFEGEGCFYILTTKRGDKSWTYAQASVRMIDEDVIRRFHGIVGVGKVTQQFPKEGKAIWRWAAMSRPDFAEFIKIVEPWLCSRRTQRLAEVLAATSRERRVTARKDKYPN